MTGDQPIVEMVDPVIEIADLGDHHRRHFLEEIGNQRRVGVRQQGFKTGHVRSFRSNEPEFSQISPQS